MSDDHQREASRRGALAAGSLRARERLLRLWRAESKRPAPEEPRHGGWGGRHVSCPSRTTKRFPGVLNGGIIGALLDCHSNWTAAYALMQARGEATPPCTVTAEFHVKLRHPTPTDVPLTLLARPVHISGGPSSSRPEGSLHRGRRAFMRRQSHGDVPRSIRCCERGAPGVSSLVSGCRGAASTCVTTPGRPRLVRCL